MRLQDDELLLSATDLSAHLGCGHRTQLERRKAGGTLEPPSWHDPLLEVLQARGLKHEQDYIEYLRGNGGGGAFEVVDLRDHPLQSPGAMDATRAAMKSGADIIVQAPLWSGRFRGVADVLLKVPEPTSDLGDYSYLVVDTKLAAETRGGTVLQLCLYTRIVGELQGEPPEEFWVVSPGHLDDPEKFRTADFQAFARRIERELVEAVEGELPEEPTAPEPVNECDICRWWQRCNQRRRDADHPSFVAGITRLQRRELGRLGIETLTQLAESAVPLDPIPDRGSPESYERVQHQARVQLASKPLAIPLVEYRADVEPGKGLARLPEPSPGDVFLDLEGDPFVEGGGLEYLFGWVTVQDGETHYEEHWALDHAAEKTAFEALMDALTARLEAYPDACIYHFGAYEPSALKRLMGRHATREEALDQLLRGERFVDLHAVVREHLRIGIETYGLKELEAVHGFTRELDLRDARLHRNTVERALELGVEDKIPDDASRGVALYNRDDCVSTWRLRDWLEEKRAERIAAGEDLPRPELGQAIPDDDQGKRDPELQALIDALMEGVPEEPEERSEEAQARWILAHLLEWHRREAKAGWWDFFRLGDLPAEELRKERSGLYGLEHVERIPQGGRKLPVDRYRFLEQDHDVRPGRTLHVATDQELGDVVEVNLARRTIDVKKRGVSRDLHPHAVFAHEIIRAGVVEKALRRIAEWVRDNDIDTPGPYRAARNLLLSRAPQVQGAPPGAPLAKPDETTREAATRLTLGLEESVLPIQGPPGTGKTYTGARVICELVRRGKKVGITGPSHKVIRNLIDEVLKAAKEEEFKDTRVHCVQKIREDKHGPDEERTPPEGLTEVASNDDLFAELAAGRAQVAGGTVWVWTREEAFESVDVLVVDEAGQLSLANAVAAAQAARDVLLLGDPQQLEQPIQGSHPPGCDASALEHLLGEHDTVPDHRGLFLPETWRLHPSLCAFTSELFYEGRLTHHPDCAGQRLTGGSRFAGAGLHLEPVSHEGNTSHSPEEVERVAELVEELTALQMGWVNFKGEPRSLERDDLRIISPYNAQVATLKARLPEYAEWIGTVDKFQGQEAPVVIYSMATSSTEEAPRGVDFLFSLNRLNVATSRARCVCILVASPRLLRAECHTPKQMRLVNSLCRYVELSTPRDS